MPSQCADITFRANASAHQCTNSSGVVAQIVGDTAEPATEGGGGDDTGTAVVSTASSAVLGAMAVLAIAFATV